MDGAATVQVDAGLRRATIEVLRERGWAGLTLERVAEVAGRSRTTLWRQGLTRDVLVGALIGELAEDFRAAMYPILTSGGTGRERLTRGLEALCDLLDRHLPLMLANDEAFHQETAPHPDDVVEVADLAFNTTAWPYVHLRGRHAWPAQRAKARVVAVVLHGIVNERGEE